MQICKAQVYDPLYHPDGTFLPARMEVLVTGVDLHNPSSVDTEDGWTVARYGENFYLFWHEGDLGEKTVPDTEYDEESLTFHEGWINARGPIIPEPLFPVTVTNGEDPWRVFYVPARTAARWLETYVPSTPVGHWTLRANTEYAFESQIVFDLEFKQKRSQSFNAGQTPNGVARR